MYLLHYITHREQTVVLSDPLGLSSGPAGEVAVSGAGAILKCARNNPKRSGGGHGSNLRPSMLFFVKKGKSLKES